MLARSCVCARDSESFEVSGLTLFLWDNSSCLLARRVRKKQIPPTFMQDAEVNCPNIQDLWGVKHLGPGPCKHISYARFG